MAVPNNNFFRRRILRFCHIRLFFYVFQGGRCHKDKNSLRVEHHECKVAHAPPSEPHFRISTSGCARRLCCNFRNAATLTLPPAPPPSPPPSYLPSCKPRSVLHRRQLITFPIMIALCGAAFYAVILLGGVTTDRDPGGVKDDPLLASVGAYALRQVGDMLA